MFAVVDPITREFMFERRVQTALAMNDEEGSYLSVYADDGDFYVVRWLDDGWVGELEEDFDEIEEDDDDAEMW